MYESHLESEVKKEELISLLNQNLAKLDLKYKGPLVLYYLEEKSYKEIAQIMHLPISTVGVRLKRGRKIK